MIDAWDKRKLGNNTEILTGGTPLTSVLEYWQPKEIPWMSSGEVNKKRLDSTDNMISKEGLESSNARWIPEHSVLIALAGQGKTRGTVAINNVPLTTNQSIAAIIPDETLHYEFIFQNLMMRYIELRLLSSGDGTRGGLNKQLISGVIITYPNIKEQKVIGSFFSVFDNIITLQKRKLDSLKKLKKGYLQQMFPLEGEREPRVRFAGFAGEWEKQKLRDIIVKGGSGGTPKSTEKGFYDGDIPFLSITDITNSNGFINQTEKNITEQGLKNSSAWIVPKGSISFAMYASVGKLAILNIDSATSQAFYNMVFDNEIIRDFVFYTLNLYNETGTYKPLISTGTQPNLNAEKVRNLNIRSPSIGEQEIIGQFFQNLDEIIAIQQTKLDKLKQLKAAYLQKMFI